MNINYFGKLLQVPSCFKSFFVATNASGSIIVYSTKPEKSLYGWVVSAPAHYEYLYISDDCCIDWRTSLKEYTSEYIAPSLHEVEYLGRSIDLSAYTVGLKDFWLAIDRNGSLNLFSEEPELYFDLFCTKVESTLLQRFSPAAVENIWLKSVQKFSKNIKLML